MRIRDFFVFSAHEYKCEFVSRDRKNEGWRMSSALRRLPSIRSAIPTVYRHKYYDDDGANVRGSFLCVVERFINVDSNFVLR